MTAYRDFQHSIASARSLTVMYSELRRHRGLGERGRLTVDNEDLLWLPRSAVVASLSSLDAYVHAVLYERMPHALKSNPIPEALCVEMANILSIKNAASFREALSIISVPDVHAELTTRLKEKTLSFLSYQAPDKISAAYEMIGQPQIFVSVSSIWPGPRSTSNDIRRQLANYVKRRNQIAHEGDREVSGAVRHMQPNYANACTDFIENLVLRLNRVVYDH